VELNIYEKEFWRFGIDEIQYDLMAYLEHITSVTGKKVHVMALSLGATGIIAGLADPDQKHAKRLDSMIERLYLFAPVLFTVSIS